MRALKRIANWLKDSKGVATSLIEATATVAVGAILAGVAVGGAIDVINNSKVQAAITDVGVIGQAVTSFYTDNDFFPLFAAGDKTGPQSDFFGFLVSENGSFPIDNSSSKGWTVSASPTAWTGTPTGGTSAFGDEPDFKAKATGADSVEGQLIRNILGNVAGANYSLFNSQTSRGWHGPYAATLPKTDPWGDKYLVNIRSANAAYLKTITSGCPTTGGGLPNLAVFVISAGPNRTIETEVDQCANIPTAVLGDDVIYRIK